MLSLPGAIGVGAIVPVQTAINTRLRADVRDPVVTALYSFLIGVSSLLPVAWLLTGQPVPDFSSLADAPPVVISRWSTWGAIYCRQYLVVPTDRERAYRHHAHCRPDVDGPACRSLWAFRL
ncbi:DMT family transporter [Corynebacterium sp. MSK297]|uniref:DMT family transporter n=1 Tax=Corynebacterium sp. MSK297 TaxID=3050221 RepID=UPI00254D2F22|nr:DMT family transporter [Corynebacterium sp. MSK297]MDK8846114.1 DMT family transporter [Corynebacterium sp. MSK297]